MQPEELRTVAALVVLAALLAITLGALVLIVRSVRATAEAMRKLHLQQATIVGMLIRAGFRPPSRGRDWFDNADETRNMRDPYETWFTQWDLKAPRQ